MEGKQIIIFDGACGFCNKTVFFIAKRDKENNFLFVSNLSKRGQEILNSFELNQIADETLILVSNNNYFVKGDAVKKNIKKIRISGFIPLLLKTIPTLLLDFFYSIVSRFRRKIITAKCCQIPSKNILDKFIL